MHENQSSLIAHVETILKTDNLINCIYIFEKPFDRGLLPIKNAIPTFTNDIAYVALIPKKTIPDYEGIQQFLETITQTLIAEGIPETAKGKTDFSYGPFPFSALHLGHIMYIENFIEQDTRCSRLTYVMPFAGESYVEQFRNHPELSTMSAQFFKP
ncbi:MAG: hypothetical protein WC916_06490 [Candidatus Woesearchaeota archaeon]